MSDTQEKLEIHLRDGSVLYATVDEDDPGVESINTLDDFIEKVVGGGPRWVWVGDAYIHNRSISAIQYAGGDEPFDLELAEELAA